MTGVAVGLLRGHGPGHRPGRVRERAVALRGRGRHRPKPRRAVRVRRAGCAVGGGSTGLCPGTRRRTDGHRLLPGLPRAARHHRAHPPGGRQRGLLAQGALSAGALQLLRLHLWISPDRRSGVLSHRTPQSLPGIGVAGRGLGVLLRVVAPRLPLGAGGLAPCPGGGWPLQQCEPALRPRGAGERAQRLQPLHRRLHALGRGPLLRSRTAGVVAEDRVFPRHIQKVIEQALVFVRSTRHDTVDHPPARAASHDFARSPATATPTSPGTPNGTTSAGGWVPGWRGSGG